MRGESIVEAIQAVSNGGSISVIQLGKKIFNTNQDKSKYQTNAAQALILY
jgi:hypothetical protein